MQLDSAHNGKELVLPLSFVVPGSTNGFRQDARIIFSETGEPLVKKGSFVFENQTVKNIETPAVDLASRVSIDSGSLPYFSILASIILIVFRNIYYNPFRKYFVSLWNNYEIDFSLQKIGIPPVVLSLLVILLALTDFLHLYFPHGGLQIWAGTMGLVFYPMLLSAFLLFFLSLSIKFFPLIFPDIKVLFLLSFVFLVLNFSAFGIDNESIIRIDYLLAGLAFAYLICRSFLFFMVLRKYYRYRSALSLFYICALNLSTFLVLYKVLQ